MKSFSALFLALAAFLPSKVIAKDPEGLLTCLEDGDIPHIQTDSEDWLEGIEPFNLRVPVTPLAVVLATSVEHVQEAVICAAEHGIKVAARSGGHSYASFGLGGNDGQLVIQLDHMYGATLREDNVAVVLAGTRLGVVTETLFEQGRRGFSHGTCPR
jgi:FAD/FMN-containing dehydrogenase